MANWQNGKLAKWQIGKMGIFTQYARCLEEIDVNGLTYHVDICYEILLKAHD
jgi:hypothetical protein